MNNKELLLNAIEDLLAGDINDNHALCENICQKTDKFCLGYKVVSKFSKTWEHDSGEDGYPVSGLQEWNRCYYTDKTLWWTGEQLELRMSLLEHIKCEVLKLSNEEFEEVFK